MRRFLLSGCGDKNHDFCPVTWHSPFEARQWMTYVFVHMEWSVDTQLLWSI
jgi:hypothetical protein